MDYSYDFPKSKFHDAMMTGFFVGFFATIVCLIYNIVYRDETNLPLSGFISVSSIIFAVNLIFPVIGIIYYGIISTFKKADILFIALFILITAFCAWRTELVHRTSDHFLNSEFKNLLLGIVLILGFSACIFIPLLYHSKKFRESML